MQPREARRAEHAAALQNESARGSSSVARHASPRESDSTTAMRPRDRSCSPATVPPSRAKNARVPFLRESMLLAANTVAAIVLIFVNKYTYSYSNYKYPTALSAIHFSITFSMLHAMRICGVFKPRTVTDDESIDTKCIGIVSMGQGLGTPLNNMSLHLNSMGVSQIAKVLITPFILALEHVLFQRPRISTTRAFWLTVVGCGVAIATVKDLHFSFMGTIVIGFWLPLAAGFKVCTKQACRTAVTGGGGWGELQLMYKTMPASILIAVLLAPLVDKPGALTYFQTATVSQVGIIMLSGFLAFWLNVSGTFVLGACEPLTHVVLGQAKSCAILLGSYFFFDTVYTPGQIMGCVVAMSGIIAYTRENLMEASAEKTKMA